MTRTIANTLGILLAVVAIMSSPPSSGGLTAVAASGRQASTGDRAKFVGTFRLLTSEVKDATSREWVPRPNYDSIGNYTVDLTALWPYTTTTRFPAVSSLKQISISLFNSPNLFYVGDFVDASAHLLEQTPVGQKLVDRLSRVNVLDHTSGDDQLAPS